MVLIGLNKILGSNSEGYLQIALTKQETSQEFSVNCTISTFLNKHICINRHQRCIYIRLAPIFVCVNVNGGAVYRYLYIQMCGLAVVFMGCLAPKREKGRQEHQTSCIFCTKKRTKY